jgi:hypothetical protein
VLEAFLEVAIAAQAGKPAVIEIGDVLDPSIRSMERLVEVKAAASPLSRRWWIVSELRSEDFAEALRAAYVHG